MRQLFVRCNSDGDARGCRGADRRDWYEKLRMGIVGVVLMTGALGGLSGGQIVQQPDPDSTASAGVSGELT